MATTPTGRSEKLQYSTRNGKKLMENNGDQIVKNIRTRLGRCNLTKVFLAVDFDVHGHGHGSQSMGNKKTAAGFQRKTNIYKRLADEFDLLTFDASVDYARAHAAQNSMAVAAAEMSILSAASSLYPLVDRGTFVAVVAREWAQPMLTLNIADTMRPPRCHEFSLPGLLMSGGKFIYRSDDDAEA